MSYELRANPATSFELRAASQKASGVTYGSSTAFVFCFPHNRYPSETVTWELVAVTPAFLWLIAHSSRLIAASLAGGFQRLIIRPNRVGVNRHTLFEQMLNLV